MYTKTNTEVLYLKSIHLNIKMTMEKSALLETKKKYKTLPYIQKVVVLEIALDCMDSNPSMEYWECIAYAMKNK